MPNGETDPEYRAFLAAFAQGRVPWLNPNGEYIEDDDEDDADFYVALDMEDEEEEEEEDEEELDEEEDDEEVEETGNLSSVSRPRVLANSGGDVATTSSSQDNVEESKSTESKTTTTATLKEDSGGGEEWNRSEIDGLFCLICMEAWTSGGDHQVCCLPCGHIYGMSCIKKWLQQRKNSGKCPQCNRKCSLKDVRVLYASRIVVVDEELQKKVHSLEARCASLEKKGTDWCKKEVDWHKKEADLCSQVRQLRERANYLEGLLGNAQRSPDTLLSSKFGHNFETRTERERSVGSFVLLKDLKIDGARFFEVDALNQYIIIARRLSGMGGEHMLTKMSLLPPHERENYSLPMGTKAIKDLCISPHARLALLASLGKKLSVISTESNNVTLCYDLPSAAWSCSWDYNNSYFMYAGLQNGMVLQFDIRQTMKPVQSMVGLTSNPIHTLHSLSADLTSGGVKSVLSASSVGLCQWNFGGSEERPSLIPESENQGVCISLAYGPHSDNIVASFRPRIEVSGDVTVTQTMVSPSASLMGQHVQGSHVLYKRISGRYQKLGSTVANVSDLRLPKSAVIDRENLNSLFASGDEVTGELVLQELPSFASFQKIRSPLHPIRDLKYIDTPGLGLLCCLREDRLQLFSTTLS